MREISKGKESKVASTLFQFEGCCFVDFWIYSVKFLSIDECGEFLVDERGSCRWMGFLLMKEVLVDG